jgi:hypothetical protein
MAKFQTGTSGNPTGRPKGIKDKRVSLRDLLQPHAAELIQVAVDMAKMGDGAALKICMDRLVAPIREEPIYVTVPKITGPDDCVKAQAAVLNAVAAGQMLPGEGQVLSSLIDAQRRAYETTAMAQEMQDIRAELAMLKPKEKRA